MPVVTPLALPPPDLDGPGLDRLVDDVLRRLRSIEGVVNSETSLLLSSVLR